jgi:Protein kinase domain
LEHPDSELNSDPTPVFQTLSQAPRPARFAFLAPAQTSDEIGRLGRFRVLKLLGEGGMGMVFLADDPDLDRRVALKVMKPEAASHEQGRKRFLREARTAAAVEHDNVVAILQVGEDGDVPYLVMPLLKGESLEDRLRRTPKLPSAEAARLGRETAEGLAAAHVVGLVHRDVKPSNLWLERLPDGHERVKVLDFGLARSVEDAEHLTRTDALMGTAGYMAPEQARAEPVDGRADLFSLGCVLYRMCTGQMPFRGATLTAVLLQIATHNPPAPNVVDPTVPAALSDLVMRLLSKNPADRPASAREVADALRAIESALPTVPTLPATTTAAPIAATDTATAAAASTMAGASVSPAKPSRRRWTFTFALSITLTFCVLLAISPFLLAAMKAWLFPTTGQPLVGAVGPATPAALKGYIDVIVYDPDNPRRQNVRLTAPDVLPLKPGDRFAVEAEMNRPAYLYVVWIDADGTAAPIYP